ncbi:NhaP-type Na+/H+ and K+/H+ antiporter protein [Roseibium sp. TrichSKD4]|uniref:cation:proton antiporter n=1 Tax=Roseibium sp. TrichSKD4 TaxID=744980 RepID=UPI0001E56453|nr:cation:proton antiporter [Roseibium sp. TrichSKD4]EFO34130.1 NhaP-type Na+/H+ and K+/H+ antiporter protein [Roseibium sp. TrichSKD4]
MATGLLLLAFFTVSYTLIAKRLSATVITAPMVFLGFGVLISVSGLMPTDDAEGLLHIVAELALIILLFLDAAQIDLKSLRTNYIWPLRMLLIGLPLSVLLGTLAFWPILGGELPLVAIALLAAILAPTDAALGQAVVTNEAVPGRVRRGLIVESGLNDGLALPVILLFASLSASAMQEEGANWLLFGVSQIVLGPLVGGIVGWIAGQMFLAAKRRKLTSQHIEGIGAIALACACYLLADLVGGNGFISAFVAGLMFGNTVKGQCPFIYEFTEEEGQMLTWSAFFLIGLALVPHAVQHLDLTTLGLICISLFVVRPLAIWISLIGTKSLPETRLFFGWFGPRGLATALFALLIVEQIDPELGETILNFAVNAVWISVVLHGVSAVPGAHWYAARINTRSNPAELIDLPAMKPDEPQAVSE